MEVVLLFLEHQSGSVVILFLCCDGFDDNGLAGREEVIGCARAFVVETALCGGNVCFRIIFSRLWGLTVRDWLYYNWSKFYE